MTQVTGSKLSDFIEHARQKGMDHATIRMLLLSAGWKERDVVEALAQTSLEVPIPAPPDRGGAREAFLHLLTFAALYASVVALVVLLFHNIELLLPDPALADSPASWRLSVIRWSLAFVIVSFPAFLWLSRVLLGEMRANPERSTSGTRRWLTFLTLFFASLALGGDVVTLVFRLLEGELTGRFLLKVLVVLVVAGLTLSYYLMSLRLPIDRSRTIRAHRTFGSVAGGLVLLATVWGFLVAGSPGDARLQQFDDRRIEDLQAIENELADYSLGQSRYQPLDERTIQRPLPETLQQIEAAASRYRPNIRDPKTGVPYTYDVLDESRYRLCATFDRVRDEKHTPQWNHPAGYHCFELDLMAP